MTHYEILGIRKTASNDEIKDAYKKLVKKYHPDVYVGDKTFAEKKIKEINEAYDILSNPETKQAYDYTITTQYTSTYNPNNSSSYSYSAPNYSYSYKTTSSKRNAQARGSKYSYENYKKTYNTSSQGGYDYEKRYTNYHRSKTPNSNYTPNDNTSKYTEKIVDTITTSSKSTVLFFVIFLFIIFFIINLMQIVSIFNDNASKVSSNTTASSIRDNINLYSNKSKNTTANFKYNSQKKDSYLNETQKPSSNTESKDPLEEFDINDFFTDEEIMQAYQSYGYLSYSSFEEFKNVLKQVFYEAYILQK